MVAVVFIHAVTSQKNLFQQFVLTLSGCAVPIFFMLSGAFTLGNASILRNLKKYYFHKFSKIVVPVLIFSILYILWDLFLKIKATGFSDSGIYFLQLIKKWISTGIPGSGYHLWFMWVIIGFYLIAPLLIWLKNNYNNIYIYIYITLYIAGIGVFYFCPRKLPYYINWIFYLPVIMTGDFIKQLKNNHSKKINFLVAVFAVVLLVFEYFLKTLLLQGSENYLVKFLIHDGARSNIVVDPEAFQIFNLLFSVCVFFVFSGLKIKANLSKLAEISFYIYLVHYVLEGIVFGLMIKILSKSEINFSAESFAGFFIRALIVLFLSAVFAAFILKVKNVSKILLYKEK